MEQNGLIDKTNGEKFSPKVKSRFLLRYGNIPSFAVNKISELKFGYDMAGNRIWEDITISIYDVISPHVAESVMNVINKQEAETSNVVTDMERDSEQVRPQGISADIIILDEAGAIVSNYKLINPYIQRASFGDFDWSSDKVNNITIIVDVDDIEITNGEKED